MGIIPLDNPTLPSSSSVAWTTARPWTRPPSLCCGGAERHVVLSMRTQTKAAVSLMFTLAGRSCAVVILHAVFSLAVSAGTRRAGWTASSTCSPSSTSSTASRPGRSCTAAEAPPCSLARSLSQSVSRWRCGLQLLVAGSSLLRAESQLHTFTSVKATVLNLRYRVSLLSLDL